MADVIYAGIIVALVIGSAMYARWDNNTSGGSQHVTRPIMWAAAMLILAFVAGLVLALSYEGWLRILGIVIAAPIGIMLIYHNVCESLKDDDSP